MGRAQLWRNQTGEARTTLRAALKKNSNDVVVLRNLGWAALFEDDAKSALLALRPLFRLAPSQPQTAALWTKFVHLCGQNGRLDLLEGAARDITASPGAPPEMRAGARLVLADAARRAGKLSQAKTLLDGLAFVRSWRAIGPFDNAARSGFSKAFAPENEVNFAKIYKGKDDQTVRWRALPLATANGSCEIGQHLGDETPSVFYAATAIFSLQAQNVWLRFDPSGAAKIWLGGALVLSDDKYRARQLYLADPIRVPVALKAGWNSLLVKIADESDDGAFALRLTRTDGNDLPLRADASQFKFAPLNGSAPPTEMPIIGALRGPQVFEPENAALLAALQRDSGEPDAAIQTLRGALAQNAAPQAAWLYFELAQSLAADGRPDEARVARNRAISLNPRLVPAQLEAIGADEGLSHLARVQKLKALFSIHPQSSRVAGALAEAYAQAGSKGEAVEAARRATDFAPGAENFAALIERLDDANRKREADKTLFRALKIFPDSETLLRAKAERRAVQGQISAAITAYRRLLQGALQPGYLLALADLQEKARDFKGAIATLQNVRALRPQDASLAGRLADLLSQRGDKPGALALYREALSLNPAQVALREKVQLLSGEKPLFDLVAGLDAAPLIAKIPAKPAGMASMIVLDEARQVVYPDRATLTRFRQIIKVFDAAGVARHRNLDLALPTASATSTIESAKITSPGGKTRDVSQNVGEKSLSWPSLAPGDVIDVIYRVEDYQKGGLAQQFWAQWFFGISGAPVKTSRFVLITPPDVVFNVRSHGEIPRPQTRDVKSKSSTWRVREWRVDNAAPRKIEPLSPAVADTQPWLDISSIGSWKQIADWYRGLSAPRGVPDAATRAKAAELTKSARDETEKLRAIYRYVARDVQYQSTPFRLSRYLPAEGKEVMREKYADGKDKAALLTALCAAVGIKARMVLLSGREAGITPFLPSPRFNHAIVVADLENGPLWLDFSADFVPFGELSSNNQGVAALIIGEGTTDLTNTPVLPAERNFAADSHVAQLGADGKISGTVELSLSGDWGGSMRQTFQHLPQNRRADALTKIAARSIKNARLTDGTLSGLGDSDRPMQIKIAYKADNFGSKSGNSLLTRLPWQGEEGLLPALQNTSNRTQPIEQAALRGLYLSTVRLKMPAGYAPQELPAEVKDETPWGRYRFNYKVENGALLATREVLLGALRVEAADASSYAAFLEAIQTESRRQIVLK